MTLRHRGYICEAGKKGKHVYRTLREIDAAVNEYNQKQKERREIIRDNKSHRMARRLGEIKPVPEKPEPVIVPYAYTKKEGTYEGLLQDPEELPDGCVVRWYEYGKAK